MTPSQAILHLGSSDRLHSDRQQQDRFHNVHHNADMVRHATALIEGAYGDRADIRLV